MEAGVYLESGDRLSREEFERRYAQCPHIPKAELIEGVVYVASPLRYRAHALPHSDLLTWLGTYRSATPGVFAADSATVRLDAQNEVQPDLLLRLDEAMGGQSRISPDDYVEGPPEFIAEIACTAYDLHDKKGVYCRCGVQEYLVWIVKTWNAISQSPLSPWPNSSGSFKKNPLPSITPNLSALSPNTGNSYRSLGHKNWWVG